MQFGEHVVYDLTNVVRYNGSLLMRKLEALIGYIKETRDGCYSNYIMQRWAVVGRKINYIEILDLLPSLRLNLIKKVLIPLKRSDNLSKKYTTGQLYKFCRYRNSSLSLPMIVFLYRISRLLTKLKGIPNKVSTLFSQIYNEVFPSRNYIQYLDRNWG